MHAYMRHNYTAITHCLLQGEHRDGSYEWNILYSYVFALQKMLIIRLTRYHWKSNFGSVGVAVVLDLLLRHC